MLIRFLMYELKLDGKLNAPQPAFIEIDLVLHLYSSSASNSHEKTNQKR